MQRTKWIERRFNFDYPEGWLFNILERLRGTELRIQQLAASLTEEQTVFKSDNRWSIKEHIGHLSDLEDLHEGRIDDLESRKNVLRAADMSNSKTTDAHHNRKTILHLLEEFSGKRRCFISRLEKLDDETQYFKSMHPRLQTPMRAVDVAFFTAEHDDHHLASMREIVNLFLSAN